LLMEAVLFDLHGPSLIRSASKPLELDPAGLYVADKSLDYALVKVRVPCPSTASALTPTGFELMGTHLLLHGSAT
jgi:hypothetical protein